LLNQIVNADAKQICKDIPAKSVQCIFTDPVYGNMEDYTWLGEQAMRILKPGGTLVVWCSAHKQFAVKALLDQQGLTFRYPLYYIVEAKGYALSGYKMYMWTTPALVYSKGKYTSYKWGRNTVISTSAPDSRYKWNKNLAPIRTWLPCFAQSGDIVWDPFAGYGSVPYVCQQLGLSFYATEIDPEVAKIAQQRNTVIERMVI